MFERIRKRFIDLINYCDCPFDPDDNPFPQSCDKRKIHSDYCKNECPWRKMKIQDTDNKLMPCPFCGGEAYFNINSSGCGNGNMKIFYFSITCRSCKVSYPKLYSLKVDMDTSGKVNLIGDERKEAIEAWNKRTKTVLMEC